MSILKNSGIRSIGFLLLFLFGLAGCMGQDAVIKTEVPLKYVFAETPEDLMNNFVTAYTTRDAEGYANLLHEDFIFSFQACDVQKLGLSKDHYTRDDEVQTTRNMFSGKEYHKSSGQVVPAITEIRFEQWDQVGPWQAAEESAPSGAQRVNVECLVIMEREGATTITVQGQSTFYALPVLLEVKKGVSRMGFELLGWVDLTGPCGS